MKCTILGCGGSLGTPEIGCQCFTCTSSNPKNKRLRASIYIEANNCKLLVDTSTDLRQQALANNIASLDALIITHAHADHISGIDDMKPLAKRAGKIIPTYLNEASWNSIKGTYGYLFENDGNNIYRPLLSKQIIPDLHNFHIQGLDIQTFPQAHGEIISLGIRIGNFAYSTDISELGEKNIELLKNLDVWIVDCMRYHWAPTHSHYGRTLDWIARLQPKLAILTHMAHEIEYEQISKLLPANVVAGYDGMVITL